MHVLATRKPIGVLRKAFDADIIAMSREASMLQSRRGRADMCTSGTLNGKGFVIVSCLMISSYYYHPSNEIYTTRTIITRYSAFSTSRHKCYKSETKASGKQQARLGTETVQGTTRTLQSIDDVESGHGFPMTKLRQCITMTFDTGHTA